MIYVYKKTLFQSHFLEFSCFDFFLMDQQQPTGTWLVLHITAVLFVIYQALAAMAENDYQKFGWFNILRYYN